MRLFRSQSPTDLHLLHRIGMTDLDNNEIPVHHPVPTFFRVHDRWASESVEKDIMDVYLGPMGKDSAFVF